MKGGPTRRGLPTGWRTKGGHTRAQASVSTLRRICSISAKCVSSQISGGASCTTGSPRSSARQYRPASNSAFDRNPRSSRSDSSSSNVSLRHLVLDELDAVEVSVAADVAHDRQVQQALQIGPERRLVRPYVAEQVLPFEDVEVGQGDRAGHRVAAEGDAVGEPVGVAQERLGQPVGGDHRAERDVPTGHPLGAGDDVGLVRVPRGPEVLAEATERLWQSRLPTRFHHTRRGVWVPAFAGTTGVLWASVLILAT